MKFLPTLPMDGWEGTWTVLRQLIAEKVLPVVERRGNAVWQPEEETSKSPSVLPFGSLGHMEKRERPYPSVAPQFLFLLEGEGAVFVQGTWFTLRAGQGVFIPQSSLYFPHGSLNGQLEGQWLWVGIHPFGAAVHRCRVTEKLHYRSPIYIVVDERVAWLFREWERETLLRGRQNSSVSRGLLIGLFRLLREATALPLVAWAELVVEMPEVPPPLRRVVKWILCHYDQTLRLSQLGKLCGLSPFHLCRCFRQHFGLPPVSYILRVRLKVARQLLAETKLSPTAVAGMVGFTNYRHFCNLFRKQFGVSPSKAKGKALPDVKIAQLLSKIVP